MTFKKLTLKCVVLFCLLSSMAHGQLASVKVGTKTTFEVSNWMDEGGKLPNASVARFMALAKKSYHKRN